MKRVTAIATAMIVALFAAWTMNARAQDLNSHERTFMTFSNAVELPGMMLPAGTYLFKLAETPSRNVVQVLSQDEKTVHGQFLFVQHTRRDPSGETVVTFRETAAGATPAVQYWYYPGETIGKEFVYPKDQAAKIAARTHSTVLSTDGPIGAESQVSSIDENGNVTKWEKESKTADAGAAVTSDNSAAQAAASTSASNNANAVTASDNKPAAAPAQSASANADVNAQPAPAQQSAAAQTTPTERRDTTVARDTDSRAVGTSGQADTAAAQQPAPRQQARAELPKTASPLPLTAIIGVLALIGAFGVRAFRLA